MAGALAGLCHIFLKYLDFLVHIFYENWHQSNFKSPI